MAEGLTHAVEMRTRYAIYTVNGKAPEHVSTPIRDRFVLLNLLEPPDELIDADDLKTATHKFNEIKERWSVKCNQSLALLEERVHEKACVANRKVVDVQSSGFDFGYVYIAQVHYREDYDRLVYKIGMTKDPLRREFELLRKYGWIAGNYVWARFQGYSSVEKELHRAYADKRLGNSELFDLSPAEVSEILDFFKGYAQPYYPKRQSA